MEFFLVVSDPSRKEKEQDIITYFLKTFKLSEKGLFIFIPWMERHPPLPSSFDMVCAIETQMSSDLLYLAMKFSTPSNAC